MGGHAGRIRGHLARAGQAAVEVAGQAAPGLGSGEAARDAGRAPAAQHLGAGRGGEPKGEGRAEESALTHQSSPFWTTAEPRYLG